MKVKITYAPEHKSAAAATLAALRGMFPAARVHESTNKAVLDGHRQAVEQPRKRWYNRAVRHRVPPGDR